MRKLITLSFILFIMCETRPETPPILDQAVFVQVYCDVVVNGDRLPPAKRSAFADSMLAKHNVSRELFEQTVQYYSQDPARWQVVFKAISKELEIRLTQNNPASGRAAETNVPVAPKKTANPKSKP